MKQSFTPLDNVFEKMENGYEQHYIEIGDGEGMVMVNMDHSQLTEFRAYIWHISVIDFDRFPEALKLVCDFIWKEMGADTIRLDLYHFLDQVPDAKLSCNKFIEKSLSMARKGFKWKTL